MGVPLRPEAEGCGQEAGLEDWFEHQLCGGLSHTISHPRDGKGSLFSRPPRLRDVDPPRWLRPVTPGQQLFAQLLQHLLHPLRLHGGQGLAVDAGGALVASHLFPGVPQHVWSSDPVQKGGKLPPTVPLRGHIERALKCTDVFRGGVGFRHALTRPLQREHHRSPGPSLAPSCVVSGVSSTTTRSDSLCTALDFGCGLIPGRATAATDLPAGAVGSPQSTGRPPLHADPSTPERLRPAPDPRPGLLPSPNRTWLSPLGPSRVFFSTRQGSVSLRPAALFHLPSAPPLSGYWRFRYRAPLAACPGRTFTGWSSSPYWAVLRSRNSGFTLRGRSSYWWKVRPGDPRALLCPPPAASTWAGGLNSRSKTPGFVPDYQQP